MNITIFAKKRQSSDGRTFYTYLGTLKKKDGTEEKVQIKFREDCGSPKGDACPCNIIVNKEDANLSERPYSVLIPTGESNENGEAIMREEERKGKELWVSKWSFGEAYVDHSLDDYD